MADVPFSYERAKVTWSDVLRLVTQDMRSRLSRLVTPTDAEGEQMFSEWLGEVELNEGYVEGSKIIHATPDWRRRWITTTFFDNSFLFADYEAMRVLTNPTNKYRQALQAGAERALDKVIYKGIVGPARTGKQGETVVTIPQNQVVPHGNTGFTLAKLKQALQIFKDYGIENDDSGRGLSLHIVWRPNDEHSFMDEEQVTSMDFVTQKAIQDGGLQNSNVMGCDYTRYPSIPVDTTTGIHKVHMFRGDGVEYGWKRRPTSSIDRLIDVQDQPIQIYTKMDVGAARMQEKLVVEIECYYAADIAA